MSWWSDSLALGISWGCWTDKKLRRLKSISFGLGKGEMGGKSVRVALAETPALGFVENNKNYGYGRRYRFFDLYA
jgi:hypothetical protein